MLETFQRSA